MDRIWQWAWDRNGPRYSWAFYAISLAVLLPTYLISSFLVVAFEKSDRYLEAGAVTVVATLVLVYVMVLPGMGSGRVVEQWAGGHEDDRTKALDATYSWSRRVGKRAVVGGFVGAAMLALAVGAVAGGTGFRLAKYGIIGATVGTAVALIGVHSFTEAALRPARAAIAGDAEIGDSLPRSHPTFAAWTKVSMLAAMFAFAVGGAMVSAVLGRVREVPLLAVAIACAFTVFFAVPTTVGAVFAPSLRPIRDLAQGTERVAAGDYGQRLPLVQDDDLAALAASFNRMQAP